MIRQSKQHLAAGGEGDGEHFRFAATIAWLQWLFAKWRLLEQVAQQSSGAVPVGRVLFATMIAAVLAFAIPLAFVQSNRQLDCFVTA